jgi:hypothetical protein
MCRPQSSMTPQSASASATPSAVDSVRDPPSASDGTRRRGRSVWSFGIISADLMARPKTDGEFQRKSHEVVHTLAAAQVVDNKAQVVDNNLDPAIHVPRCVLQEFANLNCRMIVAVCPVADWTPSSQLPPPRRAHGRPSMPPDQLLQRIFCRYHRRL